MQQGDSFPALILGAILALGTALAYGLYRVSADVAAVAVLSLSATLACLVAYVLQTADQWNEAVFTTLEQLCSQNEINLCAYGDFDAGTEKK